MEEDYPEGRRGNSTKGMATMASIKVCEPIRVAANDPIFAELDPKVRAKLTPAASIAANPTVAVETSAPAGESPLAEVRRLAAYWRSMHQRSKARVLDLQLQLAQAETLRRQNDSLRIAQLEELLAAATARIRQLEQHCFGKKTESSSCKPDMAPARQDSAKPKPRKRGQQPGKPAPKRRDHSALPCVEEVLDLPQDQRCCSACGLAFKPFPGTEDSEILEIEVKAHRRIIRRQRYRPVCSCGKHQGIVCAPPAPRVIPKSNLGVSVWVELLLAKYGCATPVHRLLSQWRLLGLDLPSGTLIGGMKKLKALFEPVYQALKERTRKQRHWHGDETRWLVFAKKEGKTGQRWMLWVLHSEEVALYLLDPTRAHEVPQDALGPSARGIMNVDRYSAYKAMKQVKEGKITLAYCWTHVRRDFLEVARSWPEHEKWGLDWVERIGLLYKTNQERREALQDRALFSVKDKQVRQLVEGMAQVRDKELAEPRTPEARRKVLESMKEHWDGLVVFVKHPSVPMDNNQAERDLRGPVVGRKNYYGSGAIWAGELAAAMFSVSETLRLWGLNQRAWLTAYLQECALAGGKPPGDVKAFLPWAMSEQRKGEWSLKKQPSEGGP